MDALDRIDFKQQIAVRYHPEIVIAGGGIAGACAACAVALAGRTVLLVEHFATLGGMGTNGGVNGFCGETKGAGKVFNEILDDLASFNSIAPYSAIKDFAFRARKYNHEILALVLQEMLSRHHVDLLLHARVVAVMKGGQGSISHVIIAGKQGLEAASARIVIDCTGDAHVASLAGCETMKGDEQRGLQLPMSIIGFLRTRPWHSPMLAVPDRYFPGPEYRKKSDLPMVSLGTCHSGDTSVKIKVPGFDATDTVGNTSAEVEGRRKFMRVLQYYRTRGRKGWVVSHVSPTIGIREGKRVRGLYVLTVDDVRAGRTFHDAVAVGTYSLDAHKPDDDKRTYVLPKSQLNVPPYHVPLRSLIARDCPNLLVAGRHLSADQLAMSSARVMTTCAQMGQATGVVAATCIQENRLPRDYTGSAGDFEPIARQLQALGMTLDLEWYKEIKAKSRLARNAKKR